ncbi:RLA class II histocompatibility antigen, DP alpha-1 chain-like [Oryzias melastigma]|uniref:RLA class II histocompatibility antigen, DP alpha-1 chain-like n=1 Tax=Oryzias melastigma TaxID=30732 RepID=UPI00168CDA1C|nr:RLA class II histocompatibility antigen, DP alpha-1 chain-like [Oryzias melastigma]
MMFFFIKSFAATHLMIWSFVASSQDKHELSYFVGSFRNGSSEALLEFDSDEVFYVDFERKTVVCTGPSSIKGKISEILQSLNLYNSARKNIAVTMALVEYFTAQTEEQEKIDPPEEMFLYTTAEVHSGVENTIICFVSGFYPPAIKVRWTKNGNPVSEGVSRSRYYPNKDQSFYHFSTLSFTPSETDVYSCTVEHPALESPRTVLWEPEFHHQHHNLDIFFAVSLGLGLLGVATGICLFIKALERS